MPFAGPSPSCCAVFVQMEHCPATSSLMSNKKDIKKVDAKYLFVIRISNLMQKYLQ